MKLREETLVQRSPVEVWPWIVSPERFMQWNENVVSMETRDSFVLNQSFTTQYMLNGKPLQCLSTVTAIEEGRLLELKHDHCVGPKVRRDMVVVERITLEDKGNHVVVTKTVTVRNHDAPWILLPLIWFVTRFGKPTKPDRLKYLCEGREIPADTVETPSTVHVPEHVNQQQERFRYPTKTSKSSLLPTYLIPIAVLVSFVWMLVNIFGPISASIVIFNAKGYRQAVFTVEKLHHENRRRAGLQWGLSGMIDHEKERLYSPDLADAAHISYLDLKKEFTAGTRLDVWYNPGVIKELFQGRTIRVLPYTLDLVGSESRRIIWWLKYGLLPFLMTLFLAAKLQRRETGRTGSC